MARTTRGERGVFPAVWSWREAASDGPETRARKEKADPSPPFANTATGFPSAALKAGGMTPRGRGEWHLTRGSFKKTCRVEERSGDWRAKKSKNAGLPGQSRAAPPALRVLSTKHPALTRWANVWRALRRWMKRGFSFLIPALTRWANLCRAYGAEQGSRTLPLDFSAIQLLLADECRRRVTL
jgi:hypothetical protein